MKIAASLFSLFGGIRRLGAVTPITQGEIAQEIGSRNYIGGTEDVVPPTTITRSNAIIYAVNRALDSAGLPRRASTLTYIEIVTFSNIIVNATTWANWYLTGTQTPGSNVMGLRGLRGRNMRGLGDVFTPGPPEPGFSGWGLLLTLLGQGVITYGNYLMYKQTMQQQGYSFPAMTPTSKEGYIQQIMQANPNLTYQQAMDIAYPGQKQEGTPTWVWVAGGVAAVYLLTQRKTA
jgi:hypothetical protein